MSSLSRTCSKTVSESRSIREAKAGKCIFPRSITISARITVNVSEFAPRTCLTWTRTEFVWRGPAIAQNVTPVWWSVPNKPSQSTKSESSPTALTRMMHARASRPLYVPLRSLQDQLRWLGECRSYSSSRKFSRNRIALLD